MAPTPTPHAAENSQPPQIRVPPGGNLQRNVSQGGGGGADARTHVSAPMATNRAQTGQNRPLVMSRKFLSPACKGGGRGYVEWERDWP